MADRDANEFVLNFYSGLGQKDGYDVRGDVIPNFILLSDIDFETLSVDGEFFDDGYGSGSGQSVITYYRLRGYYEAGQVYESWTSQSITNLTPPSGHTLINICIVNSWQA